MSNQIRQFSVADARTFDGNPYEVAERAVAQAEAIATVLAESLEGAYLMSRNAEMERHLTAGQDPDPYAWEGGPHGQAFILIQHELAAAVKKLAMLRRAAAFDPKGRLDG